LLLQALQSSRREKALEVKLLHSLNQRTSLFPKSQELELLTLVTSLLVNSEDSTTEVISPSPLSMDLKIRFTGK